MTLLYSALPAQRVLKRTAAPAVRVITVLGRLRTTLREWRRRYRDRWELQSFDDRALMDLGLSRADRWLEARKPFWRA